jgi:hypothetical protein
VVIAGTYYRVIEELFMMPDWPHPRTGITANCSYRIEQLELISLTFGHKMCIFPHKSCQIRPGY